MVVTQAIYILEDLLEMDFRVVLVQMQMEEEVRVLVRQGGGAMTGLEEMVEMEFSLMLVAQ